MQDRLDLNEFDFESERLRCRRWVTSERQTDETRADSDGGRNKEPRTTNEELAAIVADMLTPETTAGLPSEWQGHYTIDRAREWVADREADSIMLLATHKQLADTADIQEAELVGLIILAPVEYAAPVVDPCVPTPTTGLTQTDFHQGERLGKSSFRGPSIELRLGYIIKQNWWGQGFATELVGGLIERVRRDSSKAVITITAGVNSDNLASIRVLERTGFDAISNDGQSIIYEIEITGLSTR